MSKKSEAHLESMSKKSEAHLESMSKKSEARPASMEAKNDANLESINAKSDANLEPTKAKSSESSVANEVQTTTENVLPSLPSSKSSSFSKKNVDEKRQTATPTVVNDSKSESGAVASTNDDEAQMNENIKKSKELSKKKVTIKQNIRRWIEDFEKENGRVPTDTDKVAITPMWEELRIVSSQKEEVDAILASSKRDKGDTKGASERDNGDAASTSSKNSAENKSSKKSKKRQVVSQGPTLPFPY